MHASAARALSQRRPGLPHMARSGHTWLPKHLCESDLGLYLMLYCFYAMHATAGIKTPSIFRHSLQWKA